MLNVNGNKERKLKYYVLFSDGIVVTLREGYVGDTLILPCDVTPPPDDSVAVILWYKDHQREAIYT